MTNIMQNRVDAVLSPAQLQQVKDCIRQLIEFLPENGNLTLTDDERATLASLDVDNKAFVEDALHEYENNGAGIMPGAVNFGQISNDLILFEQMDEVHSMLVKAMECVENLRRIAASEAYAMSSLVYKIFTAAAASGIPNAQSSYEKLKARYKDNGSGAKPQSPDTL